MITLLPKSSGFTYDSANVPLNPLVGQTWRERDTIGLVKDDWQWNGSQWQSLYLQTSKAAAQVFATSTLLRDLFNFDASKYNVLVKRFGVVGTLATATSPSGSPDSNTDYWEFAFDLLNGAGATVINGLPSSSQGLTLPAFGNVSRHATGNLYIELGNPETAHPRGWAYKCDFVGSPPTLYEPTCSIDYYLIKKIIPTDPSATTYINSVLATGQALSDNVKGAIATLVASLKTGSVWDKLAFMWVCLPNPSNLTSGSIYLKPYASVDRFTPTNFNLGDFNIDGLVGNGVNKWADLGVNLSSIFTRTAVTMGVYNHSSFATTQGVDLGHIDINGDAIYRLAAAGSSGTAFAAGDNVATSIDSLTSPGKGLVIGTLSATSSTLYKDKAVLKTIAVTSNPITVPTGNLAGWASRRASNSNPDSYSFNRLSMMFAYNQASMLTPERDALYDAYADYCLAIGRSI